MAIDGKRILFVDVETDGLPFRRNFFDPLQMPHIVQAAWIVADGKGQILRRACRIVKPEGFSIPQSAVKVHGISTSMAREQGTDPRIVLHVLNREIDRADKVVAHNLDFDAIVIASESGRFGMPCSILSTPGYCTMKNTKDLTQLGFPDNPYPKEWKWPTLQELYRHLFGRTFSGVHDAGADVRACYDCYWELKRIKWIKRR